MCFFFTRHSTACFILDCLGLSLSVLFAVSRSIMWPDEPSLEDMVSGLSGGDFGESWAGNEEGAGSDTTALAAAASREDDEDATEEGLGPGGGLREEWEMMTADEKVRSLHV